MHVHNTNEDLHFQQVDLLNRSAFCYSILQKQFHTIQCLVLLWVQRLEGQCRLGHGLFHVFGTMNAWKRSCNQWHCFRRLAIQNVPSHHHHHLRFECLFRLHLIKDPGHGYLLLKKRWLPLFDGNFAPSIAVLLFLFASLFQWSTKYWIVFFFFQIHRLIY